MLRVSTHPVLSVAAALAREDDILPESYLRVRTNTVWSKARAHMRSCLMRRPLPPQQSPAQTRRCFALRVAWVGALLMSSYRLITICAVWTAHGGGPHSPFLLKKDSVRIHSEIRHDSKYRTGAAKCH